MARKASSIPRLFTRREALAMTAGLGAAIPAVIAYNFFVNRVKHWAVEMEGFSLDLLNLFHRPAPKAARQAKNGL